MYSYINRDNNLCIIQLFIPDAKKADFSVYIEDRILNIVYVNEDEEAFAIPSFTKQYAVSQHVIRKDVKAIYESGVLSIKLPLGSVLDDTKLKVPIQ